MSRFHIRGITKPAHAVKVVTKSSLAHEVVKQTVDRAEKETRREALRHARRALLKNPRAVHIRTVNARPMRAVKIGTAKAATVEGERGGARSAMSSAERDSAMRDAERASSWGKGGGGGGGWGGR
jgi:hypothetical protein